MEPVNQCANLPALFTTRGQIKAPLLHSDTAKAVGYCDVNFAHSGLDLLSMVVIKSVPLLCRGH